MEHEGPPFTHLEHEERPWVIEVFPDEGYPDPVWHRGVGLNLSDLQIRPGLRIELRAWARRWEDEAATWTEQERGTWQREGVSLCNRLSNQLGPNYCVRYR